MGASQAPAIEGRSWQGLHRHALMTMLAAGIHASVRHASCIANRCLLKYILIGGDGPSRSPLDSG